MHSEQVEKIAEALAKAQGQFPVLEKKSQAYGYKYADLAESIQATQEALDKNGLSIQHSTILGESPFLRTTLFHSSGQWIFTDTPLHYKGDGKINLNQAYGSAITYARRYAIACLLNLASDKESDDDGVKSCPKDLNQNAPLNQVKEKVRLPVMTKEQCAILDGFLEEFPDSRIELLKKQEVTTVSQIPSDQFDHIVSVYERRRAKKKNGDFNE